MSDLKAHLKERGIPLEGIMERQDLIRLAMEHKSRKESVEVESSPSLSEHLLEC